MIPQAIDKMNAIRSTNHQKAPVAWGKAFKKNPDNLQDLLVVPQDFSMYHLDPVKYVCACHRFLWSRFLICKYLKSCFERVMNRHTSFSEIKRQRKSPFWINEQLVLQEYGSL